MSLRRFTAGKAAAALGAAGLLLTPAFAAGESTKRPPAVSLSLSPDFGFTPASADPRLAAAYSGRVPSLSDFKFTPAASKARPSQVRVAIRARATSPQEVAAANSSGSPVSALAPVSYNLGVAIGWRRFAVAGDVSKTKAAGSPVDSRESATVGVSYSLPRFTGRVAVSADRSEGRAAPALRDPDNYAVDVGGSYAVTKRLSVTGGVRYKIERDRMTTLTDDRVDSKAVYIGTAFKF
ncbi:MAG TPA: porin [Sphingomicrobium sp.]|nr:porin [Sphingomicrobium sp.]